MAPWALLLLAAALLTSTPAARANLSDLHDDCTASRRFTDSVTIHSLMPWIAAGRKFTLEQATAHFSTLNNSHMAAPVLVHKGEVYLVFPLHPNVHVLPFQRVMHELRVTAELYPEISFEAIIGLHDDPQSHDVRGSRLPVWGFNRHAAAGDVLLPHHYVRPDQLCHETHGGPPASINMTLLRTPFEQRERRLLGRFTHYCAGLREVRIQGQLVEECPRTYFSYLAQHHKEVGGVTLDVGPTNEARIHPAQLAPQRTQGCALD